MKKKGFSFRLAELLDPKNVAFFILFSIALMMVFLMPAFVNETMAQGKRSKAEEYAILYGMKEFPGYRNMSATCYGSSIGFHQSCTLEVESENGEKRKLAFLNCEVDALRPQEKACGRAL